MRGRIVVTLDSDLQNDPRDIPRMLAHLDGYDAVTGWRATVDDLPSKLSDAWFCSFKETGSDTRIMATTVQDLSALRRGDSVIVSGRISDVSRLGSVILANATVRGDGGMSQ